MAFYLAQSEQTPDGIWKFGAMTKISLAGKSGPLPKYVSELPKEDSLPWRVEAPTFALSHLSAQAGDQVLWITEPTEPPMRVLCICGSSTSGTTDININMEVLKAVDGGYAKTGAEISEALRLNGGHSSPNAAWTWAPPPMAIGAAVLGAGR